MPDRTDKTASVGDNSGQVYPRNPLYEENHEKFPEVAGQFCPVSGIEREKADKKSAPDNCEPIEDLLRHRIGVAVPPADSLAAPGRSQDSLTLNITQSNVIPLQHPLREKNMENYPNYPVEHGMRPDPGHNSPGGGLQPDVAGGVQAPEGNAAGAGATAEASREHRGLDALRVLPVAPRIARAVMERNHYLHSLPGGTQLAFGVFAGRRLLGAMALGVGPFNGCSLVEGATSGDCLTLTRLWLADELPKNSESRAIGVVQRELRRHTSVRFLLSYADPSQGHVGTVYQAANWLYTGLSEPTPLYDLGDGVPHHNRSLAHALGTRSLGHLRSHGVEVTLVPQPAKHRYLTFLDRSWRSRLRVPALPYPKKQGASE